MCEKCIVTTSRIFCSEAQTNEMSAHGKSISGFGIHFFVCSIIDFDCGELVSGVRVATINCVCVLLFTRRRFDFFQLRNNHVRFGALFIIGIKKGVNDRALLIDNIS